MPSPKLTPGSVGKGFVFSEPPFLANGKGILLSLLCFVLQVPSPSSSVPICLLDFHTDSLALTRFCVASLPFQAQQLH